MAGSEQEWKMNERDQAETQEQTQVNEEQNLDELANWWGKYSSVR